MATDRHNQSEQEKSSDEEGLKAYSKYTTIAIQMAVIIIGTTLGGIKLDKVAGTSHLFTVILSLLGVAAAMWLIIKEALKVK